MVIRVDPTPDIATFTIEGIIIHLSVFQWRRSGSLCTFTGNETRKESLTSLQSMSRLYLTVSAELFSLQIQWITLLVSNKDAG